MWLIHSRLSYAILFYDFLEVIYLRFLLCFLVILKDSFDLVVICFFIQLCDSPQL